MWVGVKLFMTEITVSGSVSTYGHQSQLVTTDKRNWHREVHVDFHPSWVYFFIQGVPKQAEKLKSCEMKDECLKMNEMKV